MLSDKKFFWLVTIVVLVLTLIPHVIGWSESFVTAYRAYSSFGPADTNVYYSYINQARGGALVFENLFTSEAQVPSLFHPLWLGLGWLGKLTTLATPLIFQLGRLVAGVFLLWVLYRFFIWLGLTTLERRLGLVMVSFSSGLGAFLTAWSDFSVFRSFYSSDISIAESNTFATLYHSPLFPLSQALVVLAVWFFITAWQQKKKSRLIYSGLIVFIISIIHTYDLITVAGILVAYGLVLLLRSEINSPRQLSDYVKRGLVLGPFVLPAGLYFALVLNKEPAIAGWLAQNITLSPSVWAYLLGFGLLTPLAILGIGVVIKRQNTKMMLLVTWLVVSVVLMYFPYLQIQRRLTSGIHIPLAILATLGILWLWQHWRARNKFGATVLIVLMLIGLVATPVAVIVRDASYLTGDNPENTLFFVSSDEAAVYNWLTEHTTSVEIIYAHPWTGNELAGMGRRVFIGHGHQTVNWDHKRTQLNSFFTDWTDNQRQQYVQDNKIDWIFYGSREQSLGTWDPATVPWLKPELQQADITLYRAL